MGKTIRKGYENYIGAFTRRSIKKITVRRNKLPMNMLNTKGVPQLIDEWLFTGSVKVSITNGPDIKAENTTEKPYQVATKESALKVSGTSFTCTFEPHSVTALVCAVR